MSESQIRKLFNSADTSGDGHLSKLELMKFLQKYSKQEITADDVADYWMKNDVDNDDKISFDEFYAVFQKRDKSEVKKDELEAMFKKFDTDNSGFIDAAEAEVLLAQCEDYNPEKATAYMEKIDTDGDGKINLQEFLDDFYRK